MGEVLQVMTARVSERKADRNSGVSLRFEKETMRSEGRGEEAWEIIMTRWIQILGTNRVLQFPLK